MTTKIWSKRQLQDTLKQLRDMGFPVEKLDAGYRLCDRHGREVFRAMRGRSGYLVRHHPDLFSYPELAIGA